MIHLGPGGALLLEEAVYFAKPLFTAGSAIPHAGYRLYGASKEIQAARIRHILNDPRALAELLDQQRRSLASLDFSPGDLPIWDLLEAGAAHVAAGSGSVR